MGDFSGLVDIIIRFWKAQGIPVTIVDSNGYEIPKPDDRVKVPFSNAKPSEGVVTERTPEGKYLIRSDSEETPYPYEFSADQFSVTSKRVMLLKDGAPIRCLPRQETEFGKQWIFDWQI